MSNPSTQQGESEKSNQVEPARVELASVSGLS
jgi:hypothetical protein